ncbi:Sporulation protein YpjB (SpoYpjB) [Halobacillus karajensis]|uniref:sporulation protein YpjB n=1 Tax=Halobacillus karajensis TaxID=195088 RepID=UPI0008A78E44|nr:sporulation protein YpjB [Halobacillus karajensis]SEH81088.1 Sporulation protein YpjB (SpoYpjB) [Halobacillus karajensis]
MGRAFLLFICSLIFTLIPIGQFEARSETTPDQWESFIAQYRLLVADGKQDLAERLWNKKYLSMEQYAQTLTSTEQKTWDALLDDFSNSSHGDELTPEKIVTFLEVTSSDEPSHILSDKLGKIAEHSKTETLNDISKEWKVLRPVLFTYIEPDSIEAVDSILTDLNEHDTTMGRESLNQELNHILIDKRAEMDAFIWTALLIGGAILFTLIYVSVRKYRARSRNRHKIRGGHS